MKNSKLILLSSFLVALMPPAVKAGQKSGGGWEILKDLVGTPGDAPLAGGHYTLAFAWGESTAGHQIRNAQAEIQSGYWGGRLGKGLPLTASFRGFSEGGRWVRGRFVGVPRTAQGEILFPDFLDPVSAVQAVRVRLLQDRLGQHLDRLYTAPTQYTGTDRTLRFAAPESSWQGNAAYELTLNPALRDVDGFTLQEPFRILFTTLLSPEEENVVEAEPVQSASNPAHRHTPGVSSQGVRIQLNPQALAKPAYILVQNDPLENPDRVKSDTIQQANRKMEDPLSNSRIPVAITEVNAYDAAHQLLNQPFGAPATISISYPDDNNDGVVDNTSPPIRAKTLALRQLDEEHALWVKLSQSRVNLERKIVTAPIAHFSTFALLGGPDLSAQDAFAFPVPWRPHDNNPLSGTEAGGITFTNLPSESTIRIYTLAGDLVREIRHSDTGGLTGQEKWDVRTPAGAAVASGVYLYRIESAIDAKNGKLMVIR